MMMNYSIQGGNNLTFVQMMALFFLLHFRSFAYNKTGKLKFGYLFLVTKLVVNQEVRNG